MASMSAATAAIINNNWTGRPLTIDQELSTLKKISAKKQYDIEQTVKATIKQIVLSVNKKLRDTFDEHCYTPLMCISLASRKGIDLRKRLKDIGVLKTDKATEFWEPGVNAKYFKTYFGTFLDDLKGVPQSIFVKMAKDNNVMNRKKSIQKYCVSLILLQIIQLSKSFHWQSVCSKSSIWQHWNQTIFLFLKTSSRAENKTISDTKRLQNQILTEKVRT